MQTLSCLSWNIHRCRGNDGVIDPARTLATLQAEALDSPIDALILQEADEEIPPHTGLLDIDAVAAATGLRYIHDDPAHRWSDGSHGFLGTIIFVHPDITVDRITLLDLPGRCHRGAVIADLTRDGRRFRLIGVHLSLMQALRWAQLRTICQFMFRNPLRPTILMGDLNEWRPWGGLALSPRFLGTTFTGPALPSFPINRPFLPLDRVLVTAPATVRSAEVLDGPGIRMTSDHRPLRALVDLGEGAISP
ncbi:endonuclease/exonuclease/phosphatase family protein [Yoonia sp. BS5-3]|uniref:Endonuclease/exonuclease/phosphatase family protein n=1 Tax=Yoonia phaeophyticola TaxID=3137369 RepID=A0ABZ2VAZ3_9RHOB